MIEKQHDPLEGLDLSGNIITGADGSRFAEKFLPILEAVKERVSPEVSLYVYGSVATGMARERDSDVDIISIGLDSARAEELNAELTEMFAELCRGVEIGPTQLADFEGSREEAQGFRIFLKHYCAHLAGPDISSEFPEHPGGKLAARCFNGDIATHRDEWIRELDDGAEPEELARKIARKALLAVAGLVSVHDETWTTNRVSSAQRWAELRPELADDLSEVVLWSDSRFKELSKDSIHVMLTGCITKIVDDFSERIGLWSS